MTTHPTRCAGARSSPLWALPSPSPERGRANFCWRPPFSLGDSVSDAACARSAGAGLFGRKSDMGPSGMAEMPGKVSPLSADKPGLYRFQIETGMAGKWALNLGAKVQGEADTVRGSLTFDAAK